MHRQQQRGGRKRNSPYTNRDNRNNKRFNNGSGSNYKYNAKTLTSSDEALLAPVLSDFNQKIKEAKNVSVFDVPVTSSELSVEPYLTLQQIPFNTKLKNAALGSFTRPTPIQAYSWPIILSGRDVVGIAQTGSGKTLGFSLPLLERELRSKVNVTVPGTPRVLILSPTRELCVQIAEVITGPAKSVNYNTVCVYGGAPRIKQSQQLEKVVHIVVSTPGRLIDFINSEEIDLSHVQYLVLDEADRMLNMGFAKELTEIISYIPKERQTLMFSATWPQEVKFIASKHLKNPARITVGNVELETVQTIKQHVLVISPYSRDAYVNKLVTSCLAANSKAKILIFATRKHEAMATHEILQNLGIKTAMLQGNLSQAARDKNLEMFKNGEAMVLVATDVASRGLDVPDVHVVINRSFPLTIEDYVHRVGRTGRIGKQGIAITLFTDEDKAFSGELANVLKRSNQEVPESLAKFGLFTKKKKDPAIVGPIKITQEIDPSKHIIFADDDDDE
eukprot:TRINITY_DN744_c0_g1_i1.p1 TRINITY_DN744_c0_g1~~TRINITY_DN744_c0_g1_i1.p1  ORF type:complete len:504 (+),score=69.51 TRINITY_DN744_c0_g1_i1:128-1639(+)